MTVLKVGSTGDLVKQLQTKLGVGNDGTFGPITERALKAWQQANGLIADGTAGPTALAKLGIVLLPTVVLNLSKLKGVIPSAVIAQIPEAAAKFGITTTLRLAHFLAQCGHESGGFKAVSENLNYSSKGLIGTFKKYFTAAQAVAYERQPTRIASRVYANRMGNGNEASGDGWKFRGRGYIQLTGKDNYTAFNATVEDNIIENPDLVATKYPLASAGFFFKSNNLWTICDRGADTATVTAVTRRVNGGTIGLEDRLKHFKEYHALLT